jgi:hypothetical protein
MPHEVLVPTSRLPEVLQYCQEHLNGQKYQTVGDQCGPHVLIQFGKSAGAVQLSLYLREANADATNA